VSVVVVVEHGPEGWHKMSWETLAAARPVASALGLPLVAAVAGSDLNEAAAELARRDVDEAVVIEHELLAGYSSDAYTQALRQVIEELSPRLVLFPHTYQVRDFAPRLAASFGKPFVSDAVAVSGVEPEIVFVRRLFQGKLSADFVAAGEGPVFGSLQAGAARAEEGEAADPAPLRKIEVSLDAASIRVQPGERFREADDAVDLSSAERIVSVGRGIKDQDNIAVAGELAELLGAELAASRPICDNGWLPLDRQVGSSGQSVSPKLYLALGISGAIQHVVGMKGAQTIVAVNKDESAPIFEIADYGVVGDLFEVVPAMVEILKKAE